MKRKIVVIMSVIMLGVTIGTFVCPNLETYANEETTNEAITLVDQDGIYVEYRGIAEYSKDSWIINIYVENNKDEDFYLSLNNTLVNGYRVPLSNNGSDIQAGSKYLSEPNFDLILDTEDLAAYGISKIENIKFDVDISTSMFGDEILNTPVDLEGINKEYTGELKEEQPGKEILNQDDVYVEYRGIAEYSKSSWIINLYVENNRESEIYVSLADTLVNGFSMKLSNNGINLPAHSKYLAEPNFDLIIDTEDLEAYGITSITDIKSNLQIRTSMFGDTISETKVNLNSEPDETNASDKPVETADESESEKDQSSTSSEHTDSSTIQRVQQALNDKGYTCGTADGIAGQKTKDAISAYESSVGITINGIITDELLQSLGLQ